VRPALANIITARVPEADLLIDYMTVRPQGNRAFLISDTIRRLKAADIWAKLDVLWMLAAHDAQAARLNWKAPASFACTAVNSPTFTADRGYAGNGSSSYLNTGWNPATNGVNYTLNNASLGGWPRSTLNNGLIGAFNGTNGGHIFVGGIRVNDSTYGNPVPSSSAGLLVAVRTASNSRNGYTNGVEQTANGATSVSIYSGHLYIGVLNESGVPAFYSSTQIAAGFAGAAMSAAEHAALYRVLQAYMNGVGA
jgi:hypothetical protein